MWTCVRSKAGSTRIALCVAGGLFGTIACGSDDASSPISADVVQCPDSVTVFISQDSLPTIDWRPRCSVSKLVVHNVFGEVGWFLEAKANTIEPPVKFGVVPPGAVELRPANIGAIYIYVEPDFIRAPYVALARTDATGDRVVSAGNPLLSGITDGVVLLQGVFNIAPSLPERFVFTRLRAIPSGDWADMEDLLNIRGGIVEDLVRQPTGEQFVVRYEDFLFADVPVDGGTEIVVWDHPGKESAEGGF